MRLNPNTQVRALAVAEAHLNPRKPGKQDLALPLGGPTKQLSARYALLSLITCASIATHAQTKPPAETYQSGYKQDQADFGGPSGVESELETLDESKDSLYRIDAISRAFTPWFDWKRKLNESSRIKLSLNSLFLYQHSNEESPVSERRQAGGGIYRFQGSWGAFSNDRSHGSLSWRAEARKAISGSPAPQTHGSEFMASLSPGFPYSENFDTDLSVLSWSQTFSKPRIGYTVGRLAFDAYLDPSAVQSPYGSFLNRAFVFNPTLASTGAGALGAVVKGMLTDNFWIGGQLYDGNATNGEWDFDTFKEHEWLKAVEIGWTPGFNKRANNRVQLTYWEKDERHSAGVVAGYGWALSASYEWSSALMPFLRIGHSNGGAGVAAEHALSTGFTLAASDREVWGLGVGWAEPSEKTHGQRLDNEWVIEGSYKMQVAPNFTLTPDLQLLFNPADTPQHDTLWIASVRAVFTL